MRRRPISCALLLLAVFPSLMSFAEKPSLDAMIQGLAGDDEKARAVARQMLPHESVSVVPMIVPLIGHESEAVWRATFNVLADFANEVSVPGREKERVAVTTALMTLVAPEKPVEIKEPGLQLLSLVVSEGFDISPIGALLEDPEMRERARGALQIMGTRQARGALRSALSSADPVFVPALIDSLEKMRDEGSTPVLTTLLSNEIAEIRSAAARALSHTGDAKLIPAFRVVRRRATPETDFEATNSFLMLGDSIAEKGTNLDMSRRIYSEVLKSSTHPALAGAALVGIGKTGGEHAVQQILDAIKGKYGRDLEPAAIAAFECLPGESERKELAAAFPGLPDNMKIPLLGVFGRTRNPIYLGLLEKTAKEGSTKVRMQALIALAGTESPNAVSILAEGTEDPDNGIRETASHSLLSLASSLGSQGKNEDAGKTFLLLYNATDGEDLRARALEGIAQFPVPESIEVLLSSVGNQEVSVDFLASVAEKLDRAGHEEEAGRLLAVLVKRATNTETVQKILHLSGHHGFKSDLAHRLGFVTNWSLAGPFPWTAEDGSTKNAINEPDVDLNATYNVGGEEIRWAASRTSDPGGLVNLAAIFGELSGVTAYAYTEVSLEQQSEAIVCIGSDDGVKVWVNGEPVHENNTDRGVALDQDRVPVKFKQGKNTFLIQITQGGGGWGFCVRLTRPDGTPLICKSIDRDKSP